MRRRRQKNPLLRRIVIISVAIHLIALPILAHFNAFKSIQKSFTQVQMVVLAPPPDAVAPKPEAREKKVAAKSSAKKSVSSSQQRRGAIKIAANSPHVAVATGGTDDGDDGGTVTQGAGGQGAPPVNDGKAGGGVPVAPSPPVKPAPVPEPKPAPPIDVKPAPPVKPTPKPIETVAPPAVKKEPVFTEAIAIGEQPALDIPEDLRTEALDKTFVAECTVSAEGAITEVSVVQKTGVDALDKRAAQAARKWRFKPATRDGQPIESRVRLHIEFQVN